MSRNLYFSECIRTNPDQFDTLYDTVRMLRFMVAAYHWTSYTLRISEKFEKANEGHKDQIKGQTLLKIKFDIFFTHIRSFGYVTLEFAFV